MLNLSEEQLNNSPYNKLTQKELKTKFDDFSKKPVKEACNDIVLIVFELINQLYGYSATYQDIELINSFLNNESVDIANSRAYYPFLVYAIMKHLNKEQVHCLFLDDYSARTYYEKSIKLFTALNIGISYNSNVNINSFIKNQIYSYNIIFSNWKRIVFDKIDILNIKKISERFNLKFDQAFVFDIDRIIYDHEKITLKIDSKNMNPNKITAKSFFKGYKNLVGVSCSLFFEHEKIKKNYGIKTKITTDLKKITTQIKSSTEKFYSTRDEKIRNLTKKIEQLYKNKETVIVDVDSKEDLELLKEYLNLKKIKYEFLDSEFKVTTIEALSPIVANKVTLMANLTSATIESKYGGDWQEIARFKVSQINDDVDSNYFKEKLKKELSTQKEIALNNARTITNQGGINILFTSHYTELKYEYIILKNYNNILIKDIYFYNCPDDETYKAFKLDKLNIFDKQKNKENEILFKIFSKFMFYLRKYSINKFLTQQKGVLIYLLEDETKNKEHQEREKIGRNEPCPCGSGLKYKNCCGK